MEDPELIALKKLKKELTEKASKLIEKLKEQEDENQVVTFKLPNTTKHNTIEKSLEQYDYKLCDVIQQVTGIVFEKIDRKWLKNNTYKYTTDMVTKSLSVYVELTVKLGDGEDYEIMDITCHLLNIDKCYKLEIESWMQTMAAMKNFSFLTSALSQYNEQSIVRSKILNKLKAEKYINFEESTDKSGGILIHVHSSKRKKQDYLMFQWSIVFIERTWNIDHNFIITPTDIGINFAKRNRSLLKKFCKLNIRKEVLIDLWSELCSALNSYKDGNDEMDGNSE